MTDTQLPDPAAHIPCDGDTHCPHAATYRVIMHPPATSDGPATRCGHHVTLLCGPCLREILAGIRRMVTQPGPQPVCPVCAMPFTAIHDIVREVETL